MSSSPSSVSSATNMSTFNAAYALAAPTTAEERCPVRWAIPGGAASVAALMVIRYMRTTGAITPKQALPAYGVAFAGIGAMCYALK